MLSHAEDAWGEEEDHLFQAELQHQAFRWIFRTDFLKDGLVGSPCSPRALKSLLQYHSSKASILQHSAFFMVQLLHPYMTASFLSSCNFKETHSKRGRRGMEKLTGKNFLSKGVLKIKYHVTTLKTTLWEQSKAGWRKQGRKQWAKGRRMSPIRGLEAEEIEFTGK